MITCKDCKHWQAECGDVYHFCSRDALYDPTDIGRLPNEAYISAKGVTMLTGPDFGCTLAEPYHICKFCGCRAPDDQTFCSKECERIYYEVSKTYWEESASWPPE